MRFPGLRYEGNIEVEFRDDYFESLNSDLLLSNIKKETALLCISCLLLP